MFMSMALVLLTSWLFMKATAKAAEGIFKKLHLVSAAAYSMGHGANDAQKTMGIIAVLLYSQGCWGRPSMCRHGSSSVATRRLVLARCRAAGRSSRRWAPRSPNCRIIRVSAPRRAGRSPCSWPALGIPVSTTHTITGCVVGVGAARRASAVRWSVAQRVVIAWLITIPASAAVGATFYFIATKF
jgi:PiT family inorganic phosphate transporter